MHVKKKKVKFHSPVRRVNCTFCCDGDGDGGGLTTQLGFDARV